MRTGILGGPTPTSPTAGFWNREEIALTPKLLCSALISVNEMGVNGKQDERLTE